MLIDHIYMMAKVGVEEEFSFEAHRDVIETMERFSRELERLDELAEQGRVEVLSQHSQSASGETYVDRVRFKRMK